MVDREGIVAIGLLTARDLEMLGTGFKRAYPIADAAGFEDLLAAIDRADGQWIEEMRSRKDPPSG